jgi:acyl-CoA reductase-like NAD-dependent aldehyde dehydrogenase
MEFNQDYRMLIAGKLVAAKNKIEVINPSTAETMALAPDASQADLDRAIGAARAAFPLWSALPVDTRRKSILALADKIEASSEVLSRLLTAEQGKPYADANSEVMGAAAWLRGTTSLDLPITVNEDSEARYSETRHVPMGVVAAIAPWNYPLLLAAFKIGPALLAGNCLVLKPSPFTPLATLKLGELALDLFPAGVFNIISGCNSLGPKLTSHPGVDKISFTGSTETGRKVLASASGSLKRVTLELGGNDPAIIMHDVDVSILTEDLFWAAFGNAGQICIASKRVYIHTAVYEELRDALVHYAKTIKVGDGLEQGTRIGPINNRPQFERLRHLVQDARQAGIRFAFEGDIPNSPGFFLPVTILDNPPEDSSIVQEEQFGPIMPLLRFDSYDEVITKANATPYGLGASIWAKDEEAAWELGTRVKAGTVWINEARHLSPLVPFAGHDQSGFGVEGGLDGLLEFTVPKTLIRKRQAV